MKESLVVSEAKARELKEAGFNQETYFYYVDGRVISRETLAYMGNYKALEEAIFAPMVGEILGWSPDDEADLWIEMHKGIKEFVPEEIIGIGITKKHVDKLKKIIKRADLWIQENV